MRLVTDMVEYCSRELPKWHPISISGYHIREAGSTAAQELAFTLADGFTYVEWAVERGSTSTSSRRGSASSSTRTSTSSRRSRSTARRAGSGRASLRDRFGARNPRSWLMRFHTQTAGVSLTAQQPEVNIVRTAIEALAAVLGGTQSLHTNSFDEALALPTEDAVRIALRTQQVIAHETESSTRSTRSAAPTTSRSRRTDRGAGVRVLRPDREAGRHGRGDQTELPATRDSRFGISLPGGGRARRAGHRRRQPLPARGRRRSRSSRSTPRWSDSRSSGSPSLKGRRDSAKVEQRLAALKEASARDDVNLMPTILDAARDYVTMGEICDAWREVWGTWRETPSSEPPPCFDRLTCPSSN